jgi:hypothetical protein
MTATAGSSRGSIRNPRPCPWRRQGQRSVEASAAAVSVGGSGQRQRSEPSRALPMTHPCAVMVSEERAVRGEGRVEPSPEGPWDASQPRLWCSRGILRLAPADRPSLRMTWSRCTPPSLKGSVSCHAAPPGPGAGMLRMTPNRIGRPSSDVSGRAGDLLTSHFSLLIPRRWVGALRLRVSAFRSSVGRAGALRLGVFASLRSVFFRGGRWLCASAPLRSFFIPHAAGRTW